jgi:hypothetical protein
MPENSWRISFEGTCLISIRRIVRSAGLFPGRALPTVLHQGLPIGSVSHKHRCGRFSGFWSDEGYYRTLDAAG